MLGRAQARVVQNLEDGFGIEFVRSAASRLSEALHPRFRSMKALYANDEVTKA
jgi:hypothetical protein